MRAIVRQGLAAGALLLACSPARPQAPAPVARAVTQPLRDTRLKEDQIPPILQLAASAPYSTAGTASCAQIRAEIGKLNQALGADVDAPAREKGQASEMAAMAASEVVKSILPGLGLVRVITGADKQQKRVEAAVYAGSVRRGYLKAIGMGKGCGPPAAPLAAARAAKPQLLPARKD